MHFTIKDTVGQGVLNATGGNYNMTEGRKFSAIHSSSRITIESGTVTATGGTYESGMSGGEQGGGSYGIVVGTDDGVGEAIFLMTGGTLTATGGRVNGAISAGIFAYRGLFIEGNADVSAYGGEANTYRTYHGNSYGLYTWDDLKINGGASVIAVGGKATGLSAGLYADAITLNGGSVLAKCNITSAKVSAVVLSGEETDDLSITTNGRMSFNYSVDNIAPYQKEATLEFAGDYRWVFKIENNFVVRFYAELTGYTVSFDKNVGEGTTESITVNKDGVFGKLPTPTREGYTFDGWYTAATGGTKISEGDNVTITQDSILYAHWTQKGGLGGDSDDEPSGLPVGAIVGIVVGALLLLLIAAYLCGYFFLYRNHKIDDKKIKVIYSFLSQKEVKNEIDETPNE